MHTMRLSCATLLASRQPIAKGFFMLSRALGATAPLCSRDSGKMTAPQVIRIPRRMQERLDNLKQVRRTRNHRVNTIRPGKLLIMSKNPQLNQSAAYTLGKFEQPVLASKGWKHKKSFGDYFTINSTQELPPFVTHCCPDQPGDKDKKHSVTFKSLKLSPEIVELLQCDNIVHPTTVQMQAIPRLLRGHNLLCAAETGSGKTLSYLLPVIQKLKEERKMPELRDIEPHVHCVVLVPSRELAEQVASVAKAFGGPFGLKVKVVGGGRGVGNIKLAFTSGPPDILVATPGALSKALQRRCLDMSELSFLIIDEADTMFDPSFADLVERILAYAQVASNPSETIGPGAKAQLAVVGATFPRGVGEVLSQVTDLGSMVVIKSQMLHFIMPHVKQMFLKVKAADKLLELHKVLKTARGGMGILVFCNGSATVNWLGYNLEDLGVRHLRLQGQMPASMRAGIFQAFQKGLVDVLVCTDIASRGLDTQRVQLVINYDFPMSHADYIHRAGRVGRAGGSSGGAVLSFVTHPWDVELVQVIEIAARRRTNLPGMETAIREPTPRLDSDKHL